MAYETILVERLGRIAKFTLNRPEARNAVSSQLWREMGTALDEFALDPELWVAIITGAGDKAFCAGVDLKEVASGRFEITEEMAHWGFAGITQHFIEKPIIAAVNGFALGGGTEIALACDLIVASEKAAFGLPEVKRGLTAGAGGWLRLPRQIPIKVAMNLIFTGDSMPAAEALRWGLVNQVVPQGEVMSSAMALAEKICENAPLSVRAGKNIAYRALDVSLDFPPTAWKLKNTWAKPVYESEDFKEGPKAFAEKRKPQWKGR